MRCPPSCNCGHPLAQYYEVYAARLKARVTAERRALDAWIDADVAAGRVAAAPAAVLPAPITEVWENIEMGDVLDDLGIRHECCRTAIMGTITFTDVYNGE